MSEINRRHTSAVGDAQRSRRVSPTQARRWRAEMDRGTTAASIAVRDGYDARTILKHVRRVRRAGRAATTRDQLLLEAQRRHQEHLAAIAGALVQRARVGQPPGTVRSPDGLPGSALADHLGKTPTGKLLRRLLTVGDDYPPLEQALRRRAEGEEWVALLVTKGVSRTVLVNQVVLLAEGQSADSMSPVASGVPNADALNAERDAILRAAQRWDEFKKARLCCDEARDIGRQLLDQLDVLRHRGYIAGSCQYCADAEGD
jgi:hypothetical protein